MRGLSLAHPTPKSLTLADALTNYTDTDKPQAQPAEKTDASEPFLGPLERPINTLECGTTVSVLHSGDRFRHTVPMRLEVHCTNGESDDRSVEM